MTDAPACPTCESRNSSEAFQKAGYAFRRCPGCQLFVSTDDASHWLPRGLGLKWWGLAPPLHLCHFSKDALRAACRIAGLEPPIFLADPRFYTVPEVITHFGESYQSGALKSIGGWVDRTWLGRRPIRVSRPEQFVAVIRSPA